VLRYDTDVSEVRAASIYMLKQEAAWTSETFGILPQHHTGSQPRTPRLESYTATKTSNLAYKRFWRLSPYIVGT